MGIGIARSALATVSVVAAGYGASKVYGALNDRRTDRLDGIKQDLKSGTQAWESWSAAVEREFPGRVLPTMADHARFSAFLISNPAPSFVAVRHEAVYRIQTTAVRSPISSDRPRYQEEEGPFASVGGVVLALAGVGVLSAGVGAAKASVKSIGLIAAGAAIGGLGAAFFGHGLHMWGGDGLGGARALQDRINAS